MNKKERALWKIVQWRVQEFVKGGQKSERFFFGYSIFQWGGPAQKMMFLTEKVPKYMCNSLKFAFFFAFHFLGGGGPLDPPPLDTRLFRQKLNNDNELLQNKAAKAEESEEKLKQHNRRLPLGDGGGGGGHNSACPLIKFLLKL